MRRKVARGMLPLESKGQYTTGRLLAEAKAHAKAHVDEVGKYFAKGAGGKTVKKDRHYFIVSSSTAQRVQKVTVMEEHDSRPHLFVTGGISLLVAER